METQCKNECNNATSEIKAKLEEERQYEYFEKANPAYALQNPRYQGICGTLGNPVFSNTPVEPPCRTKATKRSCVLPGYNQQVSQHPMYTTSNAAYGGVIPHKDNLPIEYFPRDTSFVDAEFIGGNYEDSHLTTETEKPFRGL